MSQLLPCTSFQGTRATCVLRWNGDAYDGSRGRILIQVIGILPVEIETIKMLKQLTRKSFSLGCNNRIIGCSVHNKVMIREPCIQEKKIKKKARVRKGGGGAIIRAADGGPTGTSLGDEGPGKAPRQRATRVMGVPRSSDGRDFHFFHHSPSHFNLYRPLPFLSSE